MTWLDKAAGWAKGQVDEFGRAYGEMSDRRLAAESQTRSAVFNALPDRLKMLVRLQEAPKLRGPVQPEPVPPPAAVRLGPVGSGSDIEIKDSSVRLDGLSPEMTRLYAGVVDAWQGAGGPRPVITSGNDGKHRQGSRHYSNHAIDLRGNNIDAAKAEEIRRRLQERAGTDYDVIYETFPNDPRRNHIHVEYDPKPKRR
ncbi:hypothetical protein [Phenylobacterium sp. 58.2.17]|jgi:hypothetical protein|uniref:hypothetical protein n=1 Tax=Phenylobacterium sp. 58.2.17 TaxID=2969306 RepID=UPI002263E207|nr:hypothetical protein [Phenylobacterium sp. 58.2.17]MCX7587176.1 hypothetical protein [Phenylobacterium sp. 58.2.17]